jgi:hypothetical protein
MTKLLTTIVVLLAVQTGLLAYLAVRPNPILSEIARQDELYKQDSAAWTKAGCDALRESNKHLPPNLRIMPGWCR